MRITKGMALGMAAMAILCTAPRDTRADARNYVWTYEYMTLPEGAAELEYYLTLKVPDTGVPEVSSWQHQIEVEYGITPRWDIALYQVWQEDLTEENDEFGYEGFKVRTRYRVAEQDALPLDILFYAEYERPSDLSEDDVGEVKLILAKTVGAFDVSYNQVVERALGGDGETEHKYAAGVGYLVLPAAVHVGLESTGNYSEDEYSLGPTVALARQRGFLAIGALIGLNDASPDLQARLILGIRL